MNKKEVLYISISIFLTIAAWIIFEVFGIRSNTPTEEQIQNVSINYDLDATILEELIQRKP